MKKITISPPPNLQAHHHEIHTTPSSIVHKLCSCNTENEKQKVQEEFSPITILNAASFLIHSVSREHQTKQEADSPLMEKRTLLE
jgi:hypothetical protein